jgi:hydrogenase-4 component F
VLAALMITGSPPFGLFFSEMTILKAGFASTHVKATSAFLAALIVLFCGFAFQIGRLVLGPARDPSDGGFRCRSDSTSAWRRPSLPRSWQQCRHFTYPAR